MDKFYLLFRRFTNAAFRLLDRQKWEEQSLSDLVACLTKQGGVLCPNDVKVPDGITYHLADVFLEELDRALVTRAETGNDTGLGPVPVLRLLQPFIGTMATCHSPLVYDRISHGVLDPFLQDCLTLQEEEQKKKRKTKSTGTGSSKRRKRETVESVREASSDEDDEESGCQFPALMQQAGKTGSTLRSESFQAIFQAASRSDSIEARRRRLYRLCKEEQDRLEE